GTGNLVTGNTLNLSGANTVGADVQNFASINITEAKWGSPTLTVSGSLSNGDGKPLPTISTEGVIIDVPLPWEKATGNSTNLIETTNGINANYTPVSDIKQEYVVNSTTVKNFVTGVEVDAAINCSIDFSADKKVLAYTITANQASKLTFGDVEWKDSGALLNHKTTLSNVSFDGAAVDTSNIKFTHIEELAANKKMTLVSDFGNSVGTITGTKYKVGSTLEGTGKASLVGNDLIFTADTVTSQEQTHNTVMGAEVGMAALSAGNDFVGAAVDGLSMGSNTGTDGLATFAQMGGGTMRQETGSHVNSHTWNAILALGHQNVKKSGTTEYGAFFEYGTGNYSTFNGDVRGDGSMHYTGGGLLGKWTSPRKDYIEGSIRLGSIKDDASNVLTDGTNTYGYNTSAGYYGFHLGYGKVFDYSGGRSLDVYGKFFYNHRNGVSFDAGGHYDLDAINSQILRLGARYSMKTSDQWKWYGGLAYEYEFGGEATGTADGIAIRGASTKGGSLRAEVGATITQDDSPWTVDLNLTAFAGKKRGLTGGVGLKYNF
ncbi:autotransporter, partial [Anaerovibrio sp. JC8]|uniref:autotransporter outer membrane beta-barrel domain-containing protein n=1 Tax=Anaerovibrio sp. JC8 TaxID=1240085 RepID=UPI000A0AD0F2